jgi:hypothetical protein
MEQFAVPTPTDSIEMGREGVKQMRERLRDSLIARSS